MNEEEVKIIEIVVQEAKDQIIFFFDQVDNEPVGKN